MNRFRRGLLAVALCLGLSTAAQAQDNPLVVIELFTSQGCVSCPPADAFLEELSQMPGVLALSLHVDYWDYIGWKDPFAAPRNSDRQRAYGRSLDQRFVFTPQMVIDGATQSTGTDRARVSRLIAEAAARRGGPRIVPRITRDQDGRMSVSLPSGHFDGQAVVWLAVFDPKHVTSIKRGENRGRMLKNVNVVRELKRIGTWEGKEITLAMPETPPDTQCAVLVQHEEAGQIFGAALAP